MHCVNRPTATEAREAFEAEIQQRALIAFAGGCRLAIYADHCPAGCCWNYEFVVLSPGENAPKGWTIYEQRDGRAVGRSA